MVYSLRSAVKCLEDIVKEGHTCTEFLYMATSLAGHAGKANDLAEVIVEE